MGKKKGANNKSKAGAGDSAVPTSKPAALATTTVKDDDMLLAVVEFHHMLIGSTHKKEAAALAAANGLVVGWIFMGGPSCAIVQAVKTDLLDWLQECKRAGKPGEVTYWRITSTSTNITTIVDSNKLKVMGYASGGKGEKMDTLAYKETLSQLDIPFPLPSCSFLC